MIPFLVFLGLVLIRVAAVAAILIVALHKGPDCPACRGSTVWLETPWLPPFIRGLQRRWCLDCGWEGWVRRGRQTVPTPRTPVQADEAEHTS